jgi:hypothetical protein
MNDLLRAVAGVATGLVALSAQAGGYVEGPDLSSNHLAPTVVPVDSGSNVVMGTMGFTGPVLDRDFFSITVPADLQLAALVLGPNTMIGGGGSFIGMQAGASISVDPDNVASGAALLGWHLYTSADIGTNILGLMGAGRDKIGFSGPLPAGTYSFWIQELTPPFPGEPFPPFPYELDLQITQVPEPGAYALMLGGLGLVGFMARRRAAR